MAMEPDYYEILHLSTKADRSTIIAAYRRLARRYHPDLSSDPVATERMRQFNAAVETLSDRQKRAQYDARRAKARGQTGEPGAPIESRDLMVYRQGSLGAVRRGRPTRLDRVRLPRVAGERPALQTSQRTRKPTVLGSVDGVQTLGDFSTTVLGQEFGEGRRIQAAAGHTKPSAQCLA